MLVDPLRQKREISERNRRDVCLETHLSMSMTLDTPLTPISSPSHSYKVFNSVPGSISSSFFFQNVQLVLWYAWPMTVSYPCDFVKVKSKFCGLTKHFIEVVLGTYKAL